MKEKYRSTRAWLTRLRREVHVPLKNKYWPASGLRASSVIMASTWFFSDEK
jgi:hypothetical protein